MIKVLRSRIKYDTINLQKNKETIEYSVLIKKSGNRRGEVYEDKTDNLFITFVFAGGLRI